MALRRLARRRSHCPRFQRTVPKAQRRAGLSGRFGDGAPVDTAHDRLAPFALHPSWMPTVGRGNWLTDESAGDSTGRPPPMSPRATQPAGPSPMSPRSLARDDARRAPTLLVFGVETVDERCGGVGGSSMSLAHDPGLPADTTSPTAGQPWTSATPTPRRQETLPRTPPITGRPARGVPVPAGVHRRAGAHAGVGGPGDHVSTGTRHRLLAARADIPPAGVTTWGATHDPVTVRVGFDALQTGQRQFGTRRPLVRDVTTASAPARTVAAWHRLRRGSGSPDRSSYRGTRRSPGVPAAARGRTPARGTPCTAHAARPGRCPDP